MFPNGHITSNIDKSTKRPALAVHPSYPRYSGGRGGGVSGRGTERGGGGTSGSFSGRGTNFEENDAGVKICNQFQKPRHTKTTH